MRFKEMYDFDLLVNEAEKLIIAEMEVQLDEDKENKICRCQDCVLDMAALALNNVKPSYRSSFTGVVYAQQLQDGKYMEQVKNAVRNAIEKVKKNPSHN
ncbi:MAG TPA: late competence development ComFB family protein [Spirochaetota bacterium]|nr:late competence development ComFB family protein [Spirochaetota bacterium]